MIKEHRIRKSVSLAINLFALITLAPLVNVLSPRQITFMGTRNYPKYITLDELERRHTFSKSSFSTKASITLTGFSLPTASFKHPNSTWSRGTPCIRLMSKYVNFRLLKSREKVYFYPRVNEQWAAGFFTRVPSVRESDVIANFKTDKNEHLFNLLRRAIYFLWL